MKKKIFSLLLTAMLLSAPFTMRVNATKPLELFDIQGHVQNIGWMDHEHGGDVTIGTTGQSLRLEAFNIDIKDAPGAKIVTQAHVQNIGWMNPVSNGQIVGTTGQSLRLEAVKLSLQNYPYTGYHIEYRAHVENIGWMDWVTDGQVAGTTGQSLRLEALEVRIVHDDAPNLSIKLKKTSYPLGTKSIDAIIGNDGNAEGYYSNQYSVEHFNGTTWEEVPLNLAFPAIANIIQPGETNDISINLTDYNYEPGKYRIVYILNANTFNLEFTLK